jgi:hypothetical protein
VQESHAPIRSLLDCICNLLTLYIVARAVNDKIYTSFRTLRVVPHFLKRRHLLRKASFEFQKRPCRRSISSKMTGAQSVHKKLILYIKRISRPESTLDSTSAYNIVNKGCASVYIFYSNVYRKKRSGRKSDLRARLKCIRQIEFFASWRRRFVLSAGCTPCAYWIIYNRESGFFQASIFQAVKSICWRRHSLASDDAALLSPFIFNVRKFLLRPPRAIKIDAAIHF